MARARATASEVRHAGSKAVARGIGPTMSASSAVLPRVNEPRHRRAGRGRGVVRAKDSEPPRKPERRLFGPRVNAPPQRAHFLTERFVVGPALDQFHQCAAVRVRDALEPGATARDREQPVLAPAHAPRAQRGAHRERRFGEEVDRLHAAPPARPLSWHDAPRRENLCDISPRFRNASRIAYATRSVAPRKDLRDFAREARECGTAQERRGRRARVPLRGARLRFEAGRDAGRERSHARQPQLFGARREVAPRL